MDQTEACRRQIAMTLRKLTQLSEAEIQALVPTIPIEVFKKGTVLLSQGEVPHLSYYLIQGCIRQYALSENGKEATVEFYTDEQAISMMSFEDLAGNSLYSLSCLEDCYLVSCPEKMVRNVEDSSPELKNMLKVFFNGQYIDLQRRYTSFKLLTPEERFEDLCNARPELMKRVPQHILASYLGITPETLSRYKKKYGTGVRD